MLGPGTILIKSVLILRAKRKPGRDLSAGAARKGERAGLQPGPLQKNSGAGWDKGLNSRKTCFGLDCPHSQPPPNLLTFLRRPLCRILIQLQTDKLFLIFSFYPAWRLGSKNQYRLAGDQAASDWCKERAESESRRTRVGGGWGRGEGV